jgi:hypothetical protein
MPLCLLARFGERRRSCHSLAVPIHTLSRA